ncbi:uncharacterized protein I303_105123 [Kwoniella dejecticola CBS 10117]|uniref:Nucleotide exchange factor Fes1 domain-containing protein n=1 Tax=Kwoniella dejecticola CBS 10117 TaxID=1296121 RepID=A0A1A6A3D3_9TREE|nr:uncharacterized protein I303_05432 [Kwoniella dejecticola CBS 10117]OBR84573.1 hypothetical protein I303_05432 [Kwoniella dejecticola CBS 10117]
MPDLNELLRWSIANSTQPQNQDETQSIQSGEQVPSSEGGLTIRYNPPSSASGNGASSTRPNGGTAVLHSSDSAPADLSPASTPGPGTPTGEPATFPLPTAATTGGGAQRSDLTTEMLDLILGKSDSITMKEKMAFAVDESNPLEERVEALDDFEMLIELIDNANNMPILKLWQPLLSLLSSPESEIVSNALWIIGTAAQNNIKAQAALFINNAFPQILSTYTASSSPLVRAKAIYALSASLKHWPLASKALSQTYTEIENNTGYSILSKGLKDSDKNVRKKVSFLISTLVMQSNQEYQGELDNDVRNVLEELQKTSVVGYTDSIVEGLRASGILQQLLNGLGKLEEDHLEFEENLLKALINALRISGLNIEEKTKFKSIWDGLSAAQKEERGIGAEEDTEVVSLLA